MAEVTIKALVDAVDRQEKEKDTAYRFSNGREFERKKPLYERTDDSGD